MFKLSYSTNGLTELSFEKAVFEVEKAGFQGIELSFQKMNLIHLLLMNLI